MRSRGTDEHGRKLTLVLAETDHTAPLLEVFADLDVVDEIDVGGQQVTLLEGTGNGIEGSVFVFTELGISGARATDDVDMAAATRFLRPACRRDGAAKFTRRAAEREVPARHREVSDGSCPRLAAGGM